jgi:hypothetical protein
VRRLIFIADTSKTDGSGLANLVYNSSGLVAYYYAGDLNNEVQITLATATLGTWTSGGFVAVDNTNMPGWYEIGIPDAALDGGNEVALQFRGATNMAVVNLLIALDAVDYQTARFGAPTAAEIADAVSDEMISQHLIPGSLGWTINHIRKASATIDGTVAASPAPTVTTFNLTGVDYPTGAMKHSVLYFEEGTANIALQNSPILTWTNNGDMTVTVVLEDPLTSAPQAGDVVLILPQSHVHTITDIQAGLATTLQVNDIEEDTQNIQSRLPDSLIDGRMDSNVQEINTDIISAIRFGLATITPEQVKDQIVSAIAIDDCAEPTSVPASNSSLKDKISWLFMLAKNRLTQTSNTQTVFRDDAVTSVATANVSDDGTTATRGKFQ